MIEGETSGALDFGNLREAIEGRNPDLLLGFYADDAALRILNSEAPGGPAFELRGRAQNEKCLRAVCDQEMTCAVERGHHPRRAKRHQRQRLQRRLRRRGEQQQDPGQLRGDGQDRHQGPHQEPHGSLQVHLP
jgi:hypothetical protein